MMERVLSLNQPLPQPSSPEEREARGRMFSRRRRFAVNASVKNNANPGGMALDYLCAFCLPLRSQR